MDDAKEARGQMEEELNWGQEGMRERESPWRRIGIEGLFVFFS